MLTLRNIKKDYAMGDNVVHALRGVSLNFRPNEFVSILGASGCGKTTMLNIIGGLDRYSEGDLVINGVSTKDYKDKDWDVYRNHRIGFVFQSYNLIPHQTVLGNVELALTIAGVSKVERRQRAVEALKKVGLEAELKKRPNQLSGGQMQRVAIARALVNNPEILLADEPTGALDNETSLQIMELIREIAGERLVIMVTHNPELAEKYSSRIVRLSDGLVISDSNPYDGVSEEVVEKAQEEPIDQPQKSAEKAAKKPFGKKEQASMSYRTALGLSGRNLVAKKGRTAITSIAGSIGIIGVSLVLALRGGFTTYIANTEKDMLSAYPITITETTLDYANIIQAMEEGNADVDLSRLNDSLYVNSFLTKLANNMMSTNVITQEYIDYVNQIDSEHYYAKQFIYGGDIGNNLFKYLEFDPPKAEGAEGEEVETEPMKYTMSLTNMLSMYQGQLENSEDADEYQSFSMMFGSVESVMYEMPDNEDYIRSQYDVVAGEYPDASSQNEFVLVLNSDGGMTDLVMAQLGLLSMEEVVALFEKNVDPNSKNEATYISFEEIMQHKYLYYPNDVVYQKAKMMGQEGDIWYKHGDDQLGAKMAPYLSGLSFDLSKGMEIKIGCILRAKESTSYGSLSSGLAYMPGFTQKYLADCRASAIAKETEEKQTVWSLPFGDVLAGKMQPKPMDTTLRELGGEEMPNYIGIFVKDFDHKDAVTEHLKKWNTEIKKDNEAEQIDYSDTVAILMKLVRGMLDAVTYVLVAFTAISLVVSSVMIGVITYVSVVERTKEIGVLRSLGARKKDIRRLFNAETFLIGLTAGAFGIGITYALSVPINLILKALTGIGTLAALPIGQALAMVVVSVVLTLISGLIPANAAAKKDPVIALRTE